MSNATVMHTAENEVIRREILELCAQADECGAGIPVIKAALRRFDHVMTDQELLLQVSYLEGKGLVRKDVVENARLGIKRCIIFLTPQGMDYLEGNGPEIVGVG